MADALGARRTDAALWADIKRAYEMLVARRPDSDFYSTFFNSVTRDAVRHRGRQPDVEFCATNVGRASGAVPLRVYRIGGSLPAGGAGDHRRPAVRGGHRRPGRRPFTASAPKSAATSRSGRQSGAPESIELIEPVFYRGLHAFVVGRLIGDSSITPAGHRRSATRARGVRGRGGDAVARRRRLAVRLRALLFSRRPAGGQRRHHAAALVHAAQADRRAVHGARARQTGKDRTLLRPAPASRRLHRQLRARARRAGPGHDRLHPALARPGVQGDPRPFRRAEDQHPRRRHRALPVRVPPRSRRPAGRRAGIPAPAPAARALHAGPRGRIAARRRARAAASRARI